MKISVRVKPNAREDSVEEAGQGVFIVRVKAPAREGKANAAVVKLLGAYFDVPKSSIVVRSGQGSRNKIVEIRACA